MKCEWCRTEFKGISYDAAKGWSRFCSQSCQQEWQRRSRMTRVCRSCGTEFSRPPSSKQTKFCSWSCVEADYARRAVAPTKWCSRCETEKPSGEFYRQRERRQKYCKSCCGDLQREWVAAHPEEARALWRKHGPAKEARRRAAGSVDRHTIRRLFWFQAGVCAYCPESIGKHNHLDHMTPIARGGNSDPQNLALACPSCNLRKATQTADEFLARLA